MLFYRAALPLSRQTLSYVAGVIRRHRARIGSCWRKLSPGRQAVLVAYLRKGETRAQLASRVRCRHRHGLAYVTETVRLLAAAGPGAVRGEEGRARVRGDRRDPDRHHRVAKDQPFYSGKHKKHGMNLQVISSPAGERANAQLKTWHILRKFRCCP